MSTFIHDPDATKDYSVDWTAWLEGDTISTSDWAVESGTATLSNQTVNGGVATVFVSGVTSQSVRLRNRITTAGGRTNDRSIHLTVTEQ